MADANNNLPQPLHNAAGSLAPQRPTEFAGILRLLSTLSYQDREQISAYERQVYDMLRSSPQNLDGLVAFLRIQLMQGNHQKAKAVANRIWEIGGGIYGRLHTGSQKDSILSGRRCVTGLYQLPTILEI